MSSESVLVVVVGSANARIFRRESRGRPLIEVTDCRGNAPETGSQMHGVAAMDPPERTMTRGGSETVGKGAFTSETIARALATLRVDPRLGLGICASPVQLGSVCRKLPREAEDRLLLTLGEDLSEATLAEVDEKLRRARL